MLITEIEEYYGMPVFFSYSLHGSDDQTLMEGVITGESDPEGRLLLATTEGEMRLFPDEIMTIDPMCMELMRFLGNVSKLRAV